MRMSDDVGRGESARPQAKLMWWVGVGLEGGESGKQGRS